MMVLDNKRVGILDNRMNLCEEVSTLDFDCIACRAICQTSILIGLSVLPSVQYLQLNFLFFDPPTCFATESRLLKKCKYSSSQIAI